jgi:hypothetical protein
VLAGLDPTLPQKTTQMISKVITVGGSGDLGSWIPKGAPNSANESFLLAVDVNGVPVAGAITIGSDGTLSADSTALTFVRIIMTTPISTVAPDTLNVTIRGAAQYQALVQAIDADLQAQTAPLTDLTTVSLIFDVANDTSKALPAIAQSRMAVKNAINAGFWTGNTLIVSTGSVDPIYLTPASDPHRASLLNRMAIPWSVSAQALAAGGAAVMAPTTLDSNGGLAVPIGNSPFQLIFQQTGSTRGAVATDVELAWWDYFTSTITSGFPSSCGLSAEASIASAATTAAAKASTTADLLPELRKAIDVPFIADIIDSCKSSLGAQAGAVFAASSLLSGTAIAKWAAIGKFAFTGLKTAYELNTLLAYGDNTYTVEICAGVDNQVHACVASLSLSDAGTKQYLAPGSKLTKAVHGFAADGAATVLPANLSVKFDQTELNVTIANDQLTISALEPAAGAALPGSSVSVTVTEPYTAATASIPVWIVWPILQPPQRVFSVGSDSIPVAIQLIDPDGNSIAVPDGIKYEKTTATPSQFAFNSAAGSTSSWTIPANASPLGNFNVIATDPGGNDYPPLALTLAPLPTVDLTATPTTVDPGGTSTISWTSTNATSCSAKEGWSASKATSGSISVGPLTQTTTYTITCSDGNGSVSAPSAATVNVGPVMLTVYEFFNPQSQVGTGIDILTPVSIPITGSIFTSSCTPNFSGPPQCSSNTSPINQTPGTQKGASAGYSGTQIGTIVNGTALYNPHVCSVGKKWIARPTYTWRVLENDGLPNSAGCSGAGFIRTRSGTVDLNASGDLTITLLWDDANHWTCPNTPQYSETVVTDNHLTSSYAVNLNTGAGSYSETTVYPFREDITALVAGLTSSFSETDTNDGGSANWPTGTPLTNVGLQVVRTVPSTDPVPAECTTP